MKRIAVWGIGSIGASLAARIEQAGLAPTLIARPAAVALINEKGLENRTAGKSSVVHPRCVSDTREAGPQDLVLITVKAHSGPALMPQLAPLLDANTTVVSLVNGLPWWYFGPGEKSNATQGAFEAVDPDGAQWNAIGPARTLGAVVKHVAHMNAPNIVAEGGKGLFIFGELDGRISPRLEAVCEILNKAGYASKASADIRNDVWQKLLGNISSGPVAALTRSSVSGCLSTPGLRSIGRRLLMESKSVAEALGVALDVDPEERLDEAARLGSHKPSMLQDVEAGRRLEVEAMVGAVTALGQRAGVPTPTVDDILAMTRMLDQSLST